MGFLRCWLIRCVILAVLVAAAAGAWVAHTWVSPEKVREALLVALREKFPDAEVEIESARLRLFGGIAVSGLKVTRKGDPAPFFECPSAVIAHDKEQLGRGRLLIRKVELDSPTVRLDRRADGSWNLAGLTERGSPDQPIPTVIVRKATVIVTDHRPGGLPPLALAQARLHLLNDPVAVLKVEAHGTVVPAPGGRPPEGTPPLAIPATVAAKVNRATGAAAVRVEVADLAVTPDLAPALARLDPTLAEHAEQFTARVGVRADLALVPNQPPKYDARVDVRDGRWECDKLPWPIEHLSAAVRVQDGKVTVDKGTARLGKASVEFSLETRATASQKESLEDCLDRYDLTVRQLAIDDELFARLPEPVKGKADRARRMFSPTGAVDIGVSFARTTGGWKREVDVRPNRLGIVYEKFRYPVSDVAGSVKLVVGSDGPDEFRVDLRGTAGGRRVQAHGRVGTDGPDPFIELTIAGTDVPIDDQVCAALPPKYAAVVRKLRATTRADFTATIRQKQDVNRCENTFDVRVYDGRVNPVYFPYPLAGVKGRVIVRVVGVDARRLAGPEVDTDRVEFRDFEAAHAGGRVWLSGENTPIPGTRDRRLAVRVQGLDCPADDDLKAAMATLDLGGAWDLFAPRGRVTFGADVEIIDRDGSPAVARGQASPDEAVPAVAALPGDGSFDPARDLKLTLNFKGPSVTPAFFRYPLDELAGVIRYQGNRVGLARFTARHGESRFVLDAGDVRIGEGGEVWANLGGLTVNPLVADPALIGALPGMLRTAAADLKLGGSMDLAVRQLVVKSPGTASPDGPAVYWDAELKLAGARLEAGLPWADVHGAVASVGLYEGTALGTVLGNVWLDRAAVADQPVTGVKLSYRVRPQEPDPAKPGAFAPPVLEVPDLTGTIYSGTVGGEARVVLAEEPRYRVWLTASGVKLDEVARGLKVGGGAELRGLAQGKLLLENRPDPKTGQLVAAGAGQLDVPSGRMYNLPVLMPLLKLLKLQAPDQTAFEEAHAVFELAGDKVTVSQLDLIGTAVSLGGSGVVDTRGEDVRFEFYTVWSQALRRWLTTPLGDVTGFLSGNLFKIEMVKQPNGEMTYKPHMLPAVTDPVRAVAERLRGRLERAGYPDPPPATYRAAGPR